MASLAVVLIAGGYDFVGNTALNSAELWNPFTQNWTPTGNMTAARFDFEMLTVPGDPETQGKPILLSSRVNLYQNPLAHVSYLGNLQETVGN